MGRRRRRRRRAAAATGPGQTGFPRLEWMKKDEMLRPR